MYNIDKLYEAVAAKGHVCVGLDTAAEYIPQGMRRTAPSDAEAVLAYNLALIDSTFDAAACYKVQIAYYEEMGLAGLAAYAKTLKRIREKGGLVIADIKRGDIADTATRYAKAHFEGEFEADFVTLSPYMGMDSVEPWLAYANSKGKGAFVLMRTSNKGMRDFQYLELRGEAPISVNFKNKNHGEHGGTRSFWYKNHLPLRETPCNSVVKNIKFMMLGKVPKLPPMRLYHAVGGKLAELAAANMGKYGYGAFGAVAGCTEQEEAAALRAMYPNLFFLIPGYGAQGGAADDAALLLRQGNGGVVNASRSILKAWSAELKTAEGDSQSEELADAKFAAEAALRAALEMRDAIRAAVAKTGNGSQP